MSNTYTKIYLHLIFAVKGRESLIPTLAQPNIHAYMAGVLRRSGHYPIIIGGTDNHVHILIDYTPTKLLPDTVRELKVSTTKFINTQGIIPYMFAWQRGYSCFSHSQSQIEAVKEYIRRQYEHHKGVSLRDEIVRIYARHGIEYNEEYIFEESR